MGTIISIHSPLAGRDVRVRPGTGAVCISIHSPLAGRDSPAATRFAMTAEFQSTRPSRGETWRRS